MRWSEEDLQAHQERLRATIKPPPPRFTPLMESRAVGALKKPNKYRNVPTVVDGHRFMSRKEAERFSCLKMGELAGVIRNLKLQPRYPLTVAGVVVAHWVGDFEYEESEDGITWTLISEDVKGMKPPIYRLKKKIFEALYPRKIRET